MQRERVGVYVDQANINMNGGFDMSYVALRDFCLRGNASPASLNVYSPYDTSKSEKDSSWSGRFMGYQSAIREIGFNLKMKHVSTHDEGGKKALKSNSDIEMAVDILESSKRLDRVVIVTGDGDFAPLIDAVKRMGVRVEVIAFDNCSSLLRDASDAVYSGWIIPGLIPTQDGKIRGVIDNISIDGSDLGSIRFFSELSSDSITPFSPDICDYAVFHKDSVISADISILRGAIVEFEASDCSVVDSESREVMATEVFPVKISTRSGWYKSFELPLSLADISANG